MNLKAPYNKYAKTSIEYNIIVKLDGDNYIALLGNDLQDGITGIGRSLGSALQDLADKIRTSEFAGYNH